MPGPFPLSRIAPIALALSLLGAGGIPLGVARGDDAAPVLIVTGRVTDAQGQPIPKARVFTGDPERPSAVVDASGRYTLTLPLARAQALARQPYALSLRAEAKGWTIALPSGDAGLGLELRTVTALDGTNRCFARSNDVRVAAAAARAVGSAKEPAAVTVNFLGAKGETPRGPEPELTQTAQVALSALAMPAAPRESISVTVTEPPIVAAPPTRTPVPPKPSSTTPASPAATPATAPAAIDRSARRAEEKRVAREEKEREKEAKEKRAREEALARIAADAAKASASGTSIERQERELDDEQARREAKAQARAAKRQEEQRVAAERAERKTAERAANDALETARDVSRDSAKVAANAAREAKAREAKAREAKVREAKARDDAARAAASRMAKTTASKPAPPPANDPATRAPETPLVAEKPAVAVEKPAVAPSIPPAPATADASAPRRVVVIHPTPDGEGRMRSAPFVIRSGGAPAPETPTAADSCRCRIEGTVEVRSNEPLASRLRVVVSLAWFPAAADTVELFMGSPRAFKLPTTACGPQRLKVTLPGREAFDVITRDAVAGFRCDGGAVHQVRIVLGPR